VAELPGSRAGDVALASLVLLLGVIDVVTAVDPALPALDGLFDGTGVIVTGGLTALAQGGTVLLRRRWPRQAYALLALIGVVQFLAIGVHPTYTWGVLAFSVARAPGRAVAWLAGPLVLAVIVGTALVPMTPGLLSDRAWTALAMGLAIGVFVLVGALAGRLTRSATERLEREWHAQDWFRRATALATERARIAEEIGSGVLAGLHRLVLHCERPQNTNADLRRLSEEARSVLAAMRRVLGVLRAGADVDPPEPSAPDPPDRRRLPTPDRSGLIALAAVVAPAILLAAVPTRRLDVPTLDRALTLIDLPLGYPFALLVLSVQFAAIAWWRTAPLPALLVWGTCALLADALDVTNLVAIAGWPLLIWGAASYAAVRWSAVVVAVTTAMALAGSSFGSLHTPWTLSVAILSYVGVVPLWLAGVLVRRHRLKAEHGRRQRAEAGDREIVAQERLRVARELHDVVAHHVSAVAVQAGAARMAPDPAGRAEALAHIADSGRRVARALPELAGLTPDPDAVVLDGDGLSRLLEPVRGAGLPVETELVGAPASVAGDAELFAQRILTEALTNVLRHAGPSPTRVRVEHTPELVSVQVSDSGPVAGHRPGGGTGLGIVGMRERATLLGGSLSAGPVEPTGWTVHADLPRTSVIPA
jgi:signal transduction histidine kinase